jgi:hypothetical protein
MIDTDKYEGHTPERWTVDEEDPCRVVDVQDCTIARTDFIDIEEEREWQLANARLIADAPIILEDYKRLLKNINEYVDKVEAFHKMLKEEYEMKHKIPLCPENKDEPTKHNWTISDFVGHRCVDCGFHWGKPLYPPKWKGDDE